MANIARQLASVSAGPSPVVGVRPPITVNAATAEQVYYSAYGQLMRDHDTGAYHVPRNQALVRRQAWQRVVEHITAAISLQHIVRAAQAVRPEHAP